MICKFFTGQRVTPIADKQFHWKDSWGGKYPATSPVFGEIYVIEQIEVCPNGDIGLHFVGVVNRDLASGRALVFPQNGRPVPFTYTEFRPVIDKDTDTAVEELKRIALTGTLPLDALDPVEEDA